MQKHTVVGHAHIGPAITTIRNYNGVLAAIADGHVICTATSCAELEGKLRNVYRYKIY